MSDQNEEFAGVPKRSDLKVPNLTDATAALDSQDSFGASGEVFSHILWRRIFDILMSVESGKGFMLGLANKFLIRGRETRNANKGKCVAYNFTLTEALSAEAKKVIKRNSVTITVNFATDQSKVSAAMITPERLKCLLRGPLVPFLLHEKRFPSVSEGIGYAHLVRSLINHDLCVKEGIAADPRRDGNGALIEPWLSDRTSGWEKKTRTKAPGESNSADLDRAWDKEQAERAETVEHFNLCSVEVKDYDRWNEIRNKFKDDQSSRNMIWAAGAVAGSFSSKEVYMWDEERYPGCIWWSGVHAMMTDAANKLRAEKAPADKKTALQNSNFYPDFKKKMSARGIRLADSDSYIRFLKEILPTMKEFLRAGTGMSLQEAEVMNELIKDDDKTEKSTRPTRALPMKDIQPTGEYNPGQLTLEVDGLETADIMKALGRMAKT